MKADDIHRFFEDLNLRLDHPVRILLTGGAAAILQGVDRATFDIDFEIALKMVAGKSTASLDAWDAIQKAITKASQTVRHIHWFVVTETRGHVEDGKIAHWQVSLKAGFTLE